MLAKQEPDGMEPISKQESAEFRDLLAVFKKHTQSAYQFGQALLRIRDGRLYRSDYKSFEAFCRKEIELSKSYCTRIIGVAEVQKQVPIGTTLKESQARELIKAPADQRSEIIEAVVEQGPITAKAIRQEIAKRNPKPPEPIKPARVIDVEPVEKCAAEAAEIPKPSQVQIFAKQMRALADDMEADEAFSVGEFEFDAYIQRLSELVFEMRAIKTKEAA